MIAMYGQGFHWQHKFCHDSNHHPKKDYSHSSDETNDAAGSLSDNEEEPAQFPVQQWISWDSEGIVQPLTRPKEGEGEETGRSSAGTRWLHKKVCVDREIKSSTLLVLWHPEDLSEEMLTSLDFQSLTNKVKAAAPTLWEVLHWAAYSPEQEKWNIHKDPDMVSFFLVSSNYLWFLIFLFSHIK